MNFKIDLNESPSFIRMALLFSEVSLFALSFIAIMHFVTWDSPSNTYFRGLGVNIACVFLFAYLHDKENR